MHVKFPGEDDMSADALEDETKAMLEPANKMIASIQEHLNMLLQKCAQMQADLEESKRQLNFETLNKEALRTYGFKSGNDSALDLELTDRLHESVSSVLGNEFGERAMSGLPLDGLADALNAEGREKGEGTNASDPKLLLADAKQRALDALRSHAGFASDEAKEALDQSSVWDSRRNISQKEVVNGTQAVKRCRSEVVEMRRKLQDAIAHLYPKNGDSPCPSFGRIVGEGSASKSQFLQNAGAACLAYLNADPTEIFNHMDAGGDGRVSADEYDAYIKAAASARPAEDDGEDPLSPEDDPDMQNPPAVGCCDPFCLMRIRKFKVWAMRRAALVGKHLEVLATKKMANVLQAKWPANFKKIIRLFIATIFQTSLCKYDGDKGTCKTDKADGYLDFICLFSSIEDKHFCNTKNLEVVQGAGIHEVAVRKICSLAVLVYPLHPDFLPFIFDLFMMIMTPRLVSVLKVQKNPQTGKPYLSPTFLRNPVVKVATCNPMYKAQKEQAGKVVSGTVQSFKNSFDQFIDGIITWIKLYFKVFELLRQRNQIRRQVRPTTPLSNLIDQATLQSLVEKESVRQWTWQEYKARECMAQRDFENVKSWSMNENITRKYEKRYEEMKTEQRNAQSFAERLKRQVDGMRETLKNQSLGLIPPKEPFSVKPKVEPRDPMPLYTNYYNERCIRCDNDKAFSLNPWDCAYYKLIDYQKSYLDMLDMDAQQTATDAKLQYGGMKKASLENSRQNFMRPVRWPWVPPPPICIRAIIMKFPKPPQCN